MSDKNEVLHVPFGDLAAKKESPRKIRDKKRHKNIDGKNKPPSKEARMTQQVPQGTISNEPNDEQKKALQPTISVFDAVMDSTPAKQFSAGFWTVGGALAAIGVATAVGAGVKWGVNMITGGDTIEDPDA